MRAAPSVCGRCAVEHNVQYKPIAVLRGDFPAKFGIPRQPARVPGLEARIVFEPGYRDPSLLRGLEGFSHIWVVWHCSLSAPMGEKTTVRPPRLGGNVRMGVFATRSPVRPNPIGISCVKIKEIVTDSPEGPYITVLGSDMADGTPVLDIKPYLAYTDSVPDATSGFYGQGADHRLKVVVPPEKAAVLPEKKLQTLISVLAEDPRPAYNDDENRVFGFVYAGFEIKFNVKNGVLTVTDICSNGDI